MKLAYLDPTSSGFIVSAVVAGFGSFGVAWRSLKMRFSGASAQEGEEVETDEDPASEPSAK